MNRVLIASADYPHCATSIHVAAVFSPGGGRALSIETGGAHIHTYATRDELRALGEMLLSYANENETLEVAV